MKGHISYRKLRYTNLVRKGPWQWEIHILTLAPRVEKVYGPEWWAVFCQNEQEDQEEKAQERMRRERSALGKQIKSQHSEGRHGDTFADCKRCQEIMKRHFG